jgi:hypothetical protein
VEAYHESVHVFELLKVFSVGQFSTVFLFGFCENLVDFFDDFVLDVLVDSKCHETVRDGVGGGFVALYC